MPKTKENVDVLIISDTHLGSGLCQAKSLSEILHHYNFKKLILNGDIVDGLNFKRLRSEHWDILSYLRRLSRTRKVIWVEGNHDAQARILLQLIGVKVCRSYVWEEGERKFLAIHGHQFDRFLHKNIVFSSLAVFIYNLIQRLNGRNEIVGEFLKSRSKSWLRMTEEVARGAIKLAGAKHADVVFCGHTHRVERRKAGEIEYYNSGSWTENPSSYIVINNNNIKIKNKNN